MTDLPADAKETIKARRLALKMTQKVAAQLAGIAGTTWNTVEKGHSGGDDLTRAAMSQALGWTPDSIDRLARGEPPIVAAGGPTGGADPATAQELALLIETVNEQGEMIARLENAVRRLAGDQLLGG